MKAGIIHLTVALLTSVTVFSQERKTVNADMVWLGYFNSVKLNSKFSINSDLQGRSRNSLLSQYIGRTGIVNGINSRVFFTVGFAVFFIPRLSIKIF